MRPWVPVVLSALFALNTAPINAEDKVEVPQPAAKVESKAEPKAEPKADKSNFRLRAAKHSKFELVDADKLLLTSGELLIEVLHPGLVVTPLSKIYARSGGVLLIQVDKGIEYIFVLSDNNPQSTSLIVNKRHAKLSQGIEAIVATHQPKYQDIAGQDDVGHRAMHMHMIGDCYLLVCEFSIMHAMQRNQLLLDISHSDDSSDRALSEKLLKTAAVITTVTGRRGTYTNTGGN